MSDFPGFGVWLLQDKWGVHFAFLYHIVQDGEDELAWHMERMLRPSEEDHGIGTANSGIRTVTNAWTVRPLD